MASSTLLRRLGESISGKSSAWFGPHTSAAARAVLDRVRMVDLVLEVRDARIPLSSAFEPPKGVYSSPSFKRVIVLNKADLADRSQTDEWMSYFEEQNCVCLKVNSHNKNSMEKVFEYGALLLRMVWLMISLTIWMVMCVIKDSFLNGYEIAQCFLAILNSGEDGCSRVALKLLNLYRIGRLGHYTLDSVPRVPHGPID
ncbi:hypothetical protein QJS04_geneDACA012107 [Acorus gramineus]|uniref:Uncharacterized protein n=1 Tax=Acorus gramineus TaxID=55184 RepID=A0AAV9B9M4_ACOGR|nr:hypothetical protein QJS04_geneDACA012107 [Acorus gramineus]